MNDKTQTPDLTTLARDLDALHAQLLAGAGADDYRHLRKIERWGRWCTLLGLATAWIAPNPLSAALISQGKFARWTMLAHHILHQGYDRLPDIPERYTSRGFARGWRRWIDWFDWVLPAAWVHEHNMLHHYRLGETHDPDVVEFNLGWLRRLRAPRALKRAIVLVLAATWKPVYYAGNTLLEWKQKTARQNGQEAPPAMGRWQFWQPFSPTGRILWGQCLGPYLLWNFALLPLFFWPLGAGAAWSVMVNMLLAEMFTNLHSFAVIVTNHAGDDLYAFDEKAKSKGEFYWRQIAGSTNFRTGGELNDFLHGWLNYQIEHHLWPNLSMLQYRKAQAGVRAICRRHGVPYVQESVWRRLVKTIDIMTGYGSMRRWPAEPIKTGTEAGLIPKIPTSAPA